MYISPVFSCRVTYAHTHIYLDQNDAWTCKCVICVTGQVANFSLSYVTQKLLNSFPPNLHFYCLYVAIVLYIPNLIEVIPAVSERCVHEKPSKFLCFFFASDIK